jgi:hypothetical protein
MKKVSHAILILMLAFSTLLTSLGGSTKYANGISDQQSELPIYGNFPENSSTQIRPDTPISFTIDPDHKNYKRFSPQLEKGSFSTLLNGTKVKSTYNKESNQITIEHDLLERYTEFTIELLVKAENNNSNNNSNNGNFVFKFETGSALHEATHLEVEVENEVVRVADSTKLHIKVTDDYGLPATNATAGIKSKSKNVSAKEIELKEDSGGIGIIEVINRVKEKVQISVFVSICRYRRPYPANRTV